MLVGMPVVLSSLAVAERKIAKRRMRRCHGRRVQIRWKSRHGWRWGHGPAVLQFAGKIIVHPDLWPEFQAKMAKGSA